jgi:two-component sensor histidine kinase
MAFGADAAAVLDAIAEPALALDRDNRVAAANRRALALLPPASTGLKLPDLQVGSAAEMERYLDRCRGSAAGLPGVLLVQRAGALEKHRCRGARLPLSDGAGVLLVLDRGEEARFVALSRKVAELNEEVRERRHGEAVLAEALRERDVLLRELQHRVKNNVHMLAGLLQGAERETRSPDAKAVLRDVTKRFAAVGAVQQLVYGAGDYETINSKEMVETVAQGATTLAHARPELLINAEPLPLSIEAAMPLALILNELVTNAVKYGHPEIGKQRIQVSWQAEADHAVLAVQDNGPGFMSGEDRKRASGLGLVRGLLRQLGGSLNVESGAAGEAQGARCTVRFPVPRRRSGGSAP